MPTPTGVTGEDIRGGINDANDVVTSVQKDIRSLARDTRWEGLVGKDREEFFNGMTQKEYDLLSQIGFGMGPKGVNKLQSILQEMVSMKGGDNGAG